jgi:Fervidolysin N-terminal prodomain
MARIRWSAVAAVVLALTLAGGSGAAREPGKAPKDGKDKQVPGELIVKFRPGVTLSKKDEALAAAELKAKKKLTADGRLELAAGDPPATELALKTLGSDPRVAYAEPTGRS